MKKRFLSMLLTFAMVMSFIPATAASAAEFDFDNAYTVSVDTEIVNGTVSVEASDSYDVGVDATYVTIGSAVTVTAKPSEGYEVETVTYNGTEIEAVDGAYTFAMPGEDVTVSATFKAVETDPDPDPEQPVGAYTIDTDTSTNGTFSVSHESANGGDSITITTEPAEGYEVESVTVALQNGSSDLKVTNNGDGTYSFIMADANVTVSVTFAQIEKEPEPEQPTDLYEITVNDSEGDTSPDAYSYKEGEQVGVVVWSPESKVLDSFIVKDAGGKEIASELEWSDKIPADEGEGYFYYYRYLFTMPASDVTITVTYKAGVTHKVSFVGGDGAVIDPVLVEDIGLTLEDLIYSFEAGQAFELTSNAFVKDGHAFVGWTDGEKVYEEHEKISAMPDKDVTFTAVWEKIYTINLTVTDADGKPVEDVSIGAFLDGKIYGGGIAESGANSIGDYLAQPVVGFNMTDAEGKAFLKLPAGMYDLQVMQFEYDEEGNASEEPIRQAAQALEVTADGEVTVALPANNVSAGLVTDTTGAPAEDAATPIAVNGATDLADNLFDEYAENAEEGKKVEKVEVEVNVAPKEEDKVEEEHKTAIKDKVKSEEKKESKKFSFLEILISAVISYVGDAVGADEAIIEETKEVVMEIIVDFDMEGKDNFSFYRHHGDSVDKFDVYDKKPDAPKDKMAFFDKENHRVHIYSTKFSTFAISYDDVEAEEDDKDEDKNPSGGNPSGGNPSGGSPVIPGKKPDQPKEEPKDDQPATVGGFTDVPAGEYYADAVVWAVEKGITNGMGDGTFAPNAACTRAQMVTFLYRMAGEPAVDGTVSFSDVSSDSYYAKAIAWAVANGITNGMGNGTFAPDAECSRAQMATFLYRMQGGSASSSSEFTDVDAGAYYAEAVAWAAANNITNGMGDGLFAPNATCTRGQMVTFLFRCFAE